MLIVKKKIGCSKKKLVLLNQIHSNKIYKINKKPNFKLIGDGFFTRQKGIALAILTADCAPIFVYDKKLKIIGAAHVGWRGAFKNIVKILIKSLIREGSKVDNLVAVIGPCIKQNSYNVGYKFKKKFLNKEKSNKKFFKSKSKTIFFDLAGFIKFNLLQMGVKKVEIIKIDTYFEKNNFFSSRFSKKCNLDDYGRNISVIMIK